MSQELVLQAIKSLVDDGHQPTLALVKSRLAKRLPMPMVIEGLNAYKRNPKVLEQLPAAAAEQPASDSNEPVLAQRVSQLEAQLAEMVERIKKLEQQ
ncbi:hypothetical protein [Aliagarivorans marinus]|uniref:hypothetical protein n=1 Tax=Aliagarivorans marinus TaxID=561965 RepID=UPI000426BBDD|nr:hypothetical protein [Aliagarivorans marinus]